MNALRRPRSLAGRTRILELQILDIRLLVQDFARLGGRRAGRIWARNRLQMRQRGVQLRVLVELGNSRRILCGSKGCFQNESFFGISWIHRLIEAAVSAHQRQPCDLIILEKYTVVADGTESKWHSIYL